MSYFSQNKVNVCKKSLLFDNQLIKNKIIQKKHEAQKNTSTYELKLEKENALEIYNYWTQVLTRYSNIKNDDVNKLFYSNFHNYLTQNEQCSYSYSSLMSTIMNYDDENLIKLYNDLILDF